MAACATRPSPGPDRSLGKPAATSAISHPAAPTSSLPAPAPAKNTPSELPSPNQANLTPPQPLTSPSARFAEKLGSTFQIVSIDSESLLVSKKNSTPARTSSLFEESILLGKIRSALTSTAPHSAPLAKSASLKNGLATVPISPSTPPGTAAVTIAKILALDGITAARVKFQPPAQ
jgi:hypothetical protein